jgi:7,8-dihydropterin-6-yl-methyl-4-(beta-D-ribofuranosyl)aminobenzene 5'-phosphate synthase
MKKKTFLFTALLATFILSSITYGKGEDKISMTIVYDNYVYQENTKADWGFSCFIKGTEKTVLFDTGTNESILLENIDSLGIDVSELDSIVISHNHGDHTGGLNSVLSQKTHIPVYFGHSFPSGFSENISNKGATPVRVKEPVEICEHVFSTGELRGRANEQSLIVDTEKGLVIVTGCSHPGIVSILKRSQEILNKKIFLVLGGFHLLDHSDAQVKEIIQEFKALGVEKCGATHCTGDRAIALFKEAYGENYVPMGVGQVVRLSRIENVFRSPSSVISSKVQISTGH